MGCLEAEINAVDLNKTYLQTSNKQTSMAQLVERRTRNRQIIAAVGSSPTGDLCKNFAWCFRPSVHPVPSRFVPISVWGGSGVSRNSGWAIISNIYQGEREFVHFCSEFCV